MKFVMGPDFRAPYVNVMRWFETCVNQPQFRAVVGQVHLAESELTASGEAPMPSAPKGAAAPAGEGGKKGKKGKGGAEGGDAQAQGGAQQQQQGGKKDKKPKDKKPEETKAAAPAPAPAPAPAAAARDDEEDEPLHVEKKEKSPLQILDETTPSPFKGDVWKKIYSNTDNYADAMNQFWTMFDPAGWSLWRCDYKFNQENQVAFMTSNLVTGFLQRSGDIRKWLFGVMDITGAQAPFKVKGMWLIRGQDIAPLLSVNDDAEYYEWTKIDVPVSDATKAAIFEFWTSETTLEGEPIQDSKVFK
jgi:elongation factor 1-gamma